MEYSSYTELCLRNSRCYTRSTVSIPEQVVGFYDTRCVEFGSRRAYFNWVVWNLARQVHMYESQVIKLRAQKWKTQYQTEGLGLCRKNFTPYPEDWEFLRNAAMAFGVSMCFLFAFLVGIDFLRNASKSKRVAKSGWSSRKPFRSMGGFFSLGVRFLSLVDSSLVRRLETG